MAAAPAEEEKKGGGLAPVLGLVALLLGAGAWFTVGPGAPQPEVLASSAPGDQSEFYAIDLDELETTSVIPQIAGHDMPEDHAATPTSAQTPAAQRSSSGTSTSTTSGATDTQSTASTPQAGEPSPTNTTEQPEVERKSSGASATGGVSVRRRQASSGALSDPAEIAAMVREGMSRYSEQFAQCVTKQLNQDESFGGVWELSLVVNTDGSADRISVTPKGDTVANATFESCLAGKAKKWKFKATTEAMAFKKRYTLGR